MSTQSLIPADSYTFKRSSQSLISKETFDSLKEKTTVNTYILKGKVTSEFKTKGKTHFSILGSELREEFIQFNNYFNNTVGVYIKPLFTFLICGKIKTKYPMTKYFFIIEELDSKINDSDFPINIPLDSNERREIYSLDKENNKLYQYLFFSIYEKEIKNE